MKDTKFWIAVVATFVVNMVMGFLVHGYWLDGDYTALAGVFRGKETAGQFMPYLMAGHVLTALGLVWFYDHGKENKPWMAQGIRFGIGASVLAVIPTCLIYYAVQPIGFELMVKQIIGGSVGMVVTGMAVAKLRA